MAFVAYRYRLNYGIYLRLTPYGLASAIGKRLARPLRVKPFE